MNPEKEFMCFENRVSNLESFIQLSTPYVESLDVTIGDIFEQLSYLTIEGFKFKFNRFDEDMNELLVYIPFISLISL